MTAFSVLQPRLKTGRGGILTYGAYLLAASMVLGQTEGRAKQDDFTRSSGDCSER
jgi:hypothetical protein